MTTSTILGSSWLPNGTTRFFDRLGLVGAGAFAFGYVPSKALANIGLGLLLIAFLARLPDNWPWLRRDPLVRLSGLWLLLLLVLAGRAALQFPETAADQFGSLLEVFSFGLIPLVAWATLGDNRRVRWILALALAGIVLRIIWDGNWGGAGPLFDYQHTAFGVNKNIAGVMMDTAVVGLLLYAMHQATHIDDNRAWGRLLAAFALLGFLLLPWASNPSRATWISLAASLVFMFLFLAAATLRGALGKRTVLIFLAALLILGTAVHLGFGQKMLARLTTEQHTWRAILAGDWEHVPNTSIGQRIHMWRFALDLWLQQPWLGWGPKVNHLLATYEHNATIRRFAQFHNGHLEILVRVGSIGAVFFLAAAFLVFHAARDALKSGLISVFFFVFLLESLAIFLLNNGSISFIFFQHGWQYVVLLGGLAYGYAFRRIAPTAPTRTQLIERLEKEVSSHDLIPETHRRRFHA